MAQRPKSPLNVMFGAFLHQERKQYFANLTASEVAKNELNMSVSLYKMTEAGLASFSLNRVLLLHEKFKDSNLAFDRLLKFVSGQNIVDTLITNKKYSPQAAFAELVKVDEEFKALFFKTERYFDLDEDSVEFKKFIQNDAVEEIKRFLQDESYLLEKEIIEEEPFDKILFENIQYIPSLSIGLLFDFIKSFSHLIPLHFGEIAATWERENSRNFKKVIGVYETPTLIINEDNLSKFPHSYLLDKGLESVRYIFIKSESFFDKAAIKEKYKIMLNKCRRENNLDEIPQKIFDEKVFIELLPEKKISSVKSLLRLPGKLDIISQAFWCFTMKANSSHKIGFTGVVDGNTNVVYNLTYGELKKRSSDFKDLWKTLAK